MHNNTRPPLETYLTERGLPAGHDEEPVDARQQYLIAKEATVKQWRNYVATTTPAEDLTNLVYAREAFGLSQGDVSEIVGASVADIESAEAGRHTIADGALKAFVGGALAAIVKGGE